ncbi:MAG: hypothetical protein KF878_12015 [Planctomycetes bacterium]|nr:hypothetical protein [Planctomycetota bacterium]
MDVAPVLLEVGVHPREGAAAGHRSSDVILTAPTAPAGRHVRARRRSGVSDLALRHLERRWRETGADTDQAALLRALVRAGRLDQDRLTLATCCGHEAALLVTGVPPPHSPIVCYSDEAPGPAVRALLEWMATVPDAFAREAALEVVRAVLPVWTRREGGHDPDPQALLTEALAVLEAPTDAARAALADRALHVSEIATLDVPDPGSGVLHAVTAFAEAVAEDDPRFARGAVWHAILAAGEDRLMAPFPPGSGRGLVPEAPDPEASVSAAESWAAETLDRAKVALRAQAFSG